MTMMPLLSLNIYIYIFLKIKTLKYKNKEPTPWRVYWVWSWLEKKRERLGENEGLKNRAVYYIGLYENVWYIRIENKLPKNSIYCMRLVFGFNLFCWVQCCRSKALGGCCRSNLVQPQSPVWFGTKPLGSRAERIASENHQFGELRWKRGIEL